MTTKEPTRRSRVDFPGPNRLAAENQSRIDFPGCSLPENQSGIDLRGPGHQPGVVYLVATPIGNLEDITLRALRILKSVDLVAAEDTRHTAKLLHHFGITVRTTSLHDHNEATRAPELVARVIAGASMALVSDAGTPGVSDPGFKLVRAALDAGIRVEVIPGPSAVLAALTGSGLPTDAFVFVGFPPPKAAARAAWFAGLASETRTIVMFEAPHRIRQSLEAALEALGDRRAAVGRELTKLHEEFLRGTLSSILGRLQETRGEFTVVLAGSDQGGVSDTARQVSDREVLDAFDAASASGLDRRGAIAAAAARFGLKPRAAYAAVERARASHS